MTHNTRRHETLQRFMLTTDSVTVAIEVPVYLTPEDMTPMQQALGFTIPLCPERTLSGPIDRVQIRNGRIHILDSKPKAVRDKPLTQLMISALAVSRRTGLRLYDFVCAWFDERHYFEFFPLHVVHKRGAPQHYRQLIARRAGDTNNSRAPSSLASKILLYLHPTHHRERGIRHDLHPAVH